MKHYMKTVSRILNKKQGLLQYDVDEDGVRKDLTNV